MAKYGNLYAESWQKAPLQGQMDVPFISSGAISRAHYALVRKVESSDSTQSADHHILAEVENIRRQMARSTPSSVRLWFQHGHSCESSLTSQRQCKEYLIILLYCLTSITTRSLDLDFALPSAVNLAEAGRAVQDKRVGAQASIFILFHCR